MKQPIKYWIVDNDLIETQLKRCIDFNKRHLVDSTIKVTNFLGCEFEATISRPAEIFHPGISVIWFENFFTWCNLDQIKD